MPAYLGLPRHRDARANVNSMVRDRNADLTTLAELIGEAFIRLFSVVLPKSYLSTLQYHNLEATLCPHHLNRHEIGPSPMEDKPIRYAHQPVHPAEIPPALLPSAAEGELEWGVCPTTALNHMLKAISEPQITWAELIAISPRLQDCPQITSRHGIRDNAQPDVGIVDLVRRSKGITRNEIAPKLTLLGAGGQSWSISYW